MDYGIAGKTALVGGASKGIGRAISLLLAREGVKVALAARTEAAVREAAEQIAAETGGKTLAVAADLASPEGAKRALDAAREELGEIDILVSNTGGPRPGKFADLGDRDWEDAHALLIKSAVALIRGVLPGMRKRKWGRILGITSVSVKEPIENLVLSNVYRAGVTSLFKSLSREVAGDGVTVNTILPGLTDTERLRFLYGFQAKAQGKDPEAFLAEVSKGTPLGRLNRPEELAALALFLASDGASGITGCAIQADGGQVRGLF